MTTVKTMDLERLSILTLNKTPILVKEATSLKTEVILRKPLMIKVILERESKNL